MLTVNKHTMSQKQTSAQPREDVTGLDDSTVISITAQTLDPTLPSTCTQWKINTQCSNFILSATVMRSKYLDVEKLCKHFFTFPHFVKRILVGVVVVSQFLQLSFTEIQHLLRVLS